MKKRSLVVAIAALSSYSAGTLAQEPQKRSNRLLEEVTVTAQKREEDSQDVPIAIQAFSGEKLDAFNIEDTADLQKITPGLTFTYTYGYTLIYLRGVGSDAFLPNADPSVATYIDGINIPASQGKQDALGPVKRVEVLKGPQGTLFGRNATAGAISIVTEDPPIDEIVGNIKATRGNYDSQEYQAYLGLPLFDGAGITLAAFSDTHENYGTNFSNGEPRPWREDFSEGGRVKFKWDFLEDFSLTLIGSYVNQFNGNSLVQENTRPSPILCAGCETDTADRDTDTNYEGGNATINTMYGTIFEWRPGPVDVKFIYSDQLADVDWGQYDYDSTDEDRSGFFTYDQYNDQQTYELQILSNADTPLSENLEWVAGYYRLEAEGGFGRLFFFLNNGLATGLLPGSITGLLGDSGSRAVLESGGLLTTESDALYFQGTWRFNEEWAMTLGARYQEETREIGNTALDLVDTGCAGGDGSYGTDVSYYQGSDKSCNSRLLDFGGPPLEETTFSPKINVQWFPTETAQIYASIQKGYKSPTYNIVNFFGSPDPVEGEEAVAAELGFKSEWLDGALQLNGALFASKTDKLLTGIVSFTSGAIVRYANAGSAEAKGVEFDFQWQPMPDMNPGLAITGGATYVNSEFTDYKNGEGFDDDTGLYFGPGGLEDIATDLLGLELPISLADFANGPRDFTGNKVPRAPELTSAVSVNQFIDAGDIGAFEVAVDYSYKSEYFTTPQNSPFFVQDQYELWSLRGSYFFDPWGLQLTAFVDNVKDKEYFSSILQQDFGRSVTLAPPRLYGLKLKWDFDVFLN
ncbi:TonB-dependent receptor [Spongiibacter taiwanensis]|uniref:TonB-dependent receptor n=1 Tax=Spongiibacter taiwanensis TaxID=1748242 RepID=UPI0020359E45|nr:TonB-dependent receptor [Spongiibacter taiwanensis]USA42220.1 TonB-dependent receptor [Spongiibacter taiwanensis]